MTDLLFATPWWLLTMICGLGIAFFVIANNRQETGLRTAGLVIFLLGIGLGIVSYSVETDKEKVERHTHELISAIVASNWPTVQSLLDPQVNFLKLHGSKELMTAVRAAQENVHVTSAHIATTHIDQSPGDITEKIDVYSVQEATLDRGALSGWELDWVPTPDGKDWRLIEIKIMGGPQISPDEIESRVPGVR